MATFTPNTANITDFPTPLLLGSLFNWLLFGVLLVQTYVYHLNFGDDKMWQKSLVYGVFTIEMVQTGLNAVLVCHWLGSGFGNVDRLRHVFISPVVIPMMCGIIAGIVQCFFAYRIFTLRRSYSWICIVIVLTSITQAAGAQGAGIVGLIVQNSTLFHTSKIFVNLFNLWHISGIISDILIAGSLLWLFQETKKEGVELKTLKNLVRLIVETNTLTTSMAIVSFVVFVALPHKYIYALTTLIMGKLYSNTLLVTFNNRIALRNMNKDHAFASGRSASMRVSTRPMVFADIAIESFRAAPNSYIARISADGLGSFELQDLKMVYSRKAQASVPESVEVSNVAGRLP